MSDTSFGSLLPQKLLLVLPDLGPYGPQHLPQLLLAGGQLVYNIVVIKDAFLILLFEVRLGGLFAQLGFCFLHLLHILVLLEEIFVIGERFILMEAGVYFFLFH